MRILATLLVASVLTPSHAGLAQDEVPLRAESIHDPRTRFALNGAIRGAMQRLDRPQCRQVLSDFLDGSGRTVQDGLEDLGETPRSYLAQLTFHEGLDSRPCRQDAILAFTSVGHRDVYLCSPQFWQAYRTNPTRVEATVIHEMMHTLGLGENPPSAMEIDAQVLRRCR
jgi:hypothetical protein